MWFRGDGRLDQVRACGNGIKNSPKKETEILIKMFHIILSLIHCFLIKRK